MFGKLYNHYSTIGERIVLFKKPNKKLTYLILHFGVMKTNELFRLYTNFEISGLKCSFHQSSCFLCRRRELDKHSIFRIGQNRKHLT